MGNIQVKHSRFFNCFNPIKIHKDNRLEIEYVFFNKSKLFISGMHNTMRIEGLIFIIVISKYLVMVIK